MSLILIRECCMRITSQVFMPYVRQAGAACHIMAHFLQTKHLELESERQQLQCQLQEAEQSTQQLQGEVDRMEPELQQLQQQLMHMQEAKQEAETRVQDLSSELEVSHTRHAWPCHCHCFDQSITSDCGLSPVPHQIALMLCRSSLSLVHCLAC